jgi:hypothetical protein
VFKIDPNTRAGRQMAAGRVAVTFTSPSGTHITLVAKARTVTDEVWHGCSLDEAKVVFIEVPNAGGGWNDKVGKVTRSKGFVPAPGADPARVWCVSQLLAFVAGEATAPGLEVVSSDHCGKCGRELKQPESIARGIGPECFGQATTGQHQTKSKPATRRAAPAECDGLDKDGVSYAQGDWRSRKKALKAGVADGGGTPRMDTILGDREAGSSQMNYLPGETFEDIFV